MSRHILLLAALALAACATPIPPPSGEPLGRYQIAPALLEADALLTSLGVDAATRQRIDTALAAIRQHPDFIAAEGAGGLRGVAAFSSSAGALVFRGEVGAGKASFAGGRQRVPFKFSCWSGGASVGGESIAGVVLITGLTHETAFPGNYGCRALGGFAGPAGSRTVVARAEGGRELYVAAAGVGFGGDASLGRLIFEWARLHDQ